MIECKHVSIPLNDTSNLKVGDHVVFSGRILCGRDAVLPKLCELIAEGRLSEVDADLKGGAIFHTAVSDAGIGPTSSNKLEILESFIPLSKAGVKVFLGKGAISTETVHAMDEYGAVFAVVPPVTALLGSSLENKRCVAYPEFGMEALYELVLTQCPAVIAAAHGESMFEGV